MQEQSSRVRAVPPLRVLLVVLLLTGFGLWQAWQCSDGMAASPIAGMPSMSTTMPGSSSVDITVAAHEPDTDHGMPAGVAGLCISVLVSIAVALLLAVFSPRLLGLARRMIVGLVRQVNIPRPGLSLTQLCVSRT